MSFSDFDKLFQANATKVIADNDRFFRLDIDKQLIWEAYLSGFKDPKVRQEYNCNCCRRFIQNYGGIVVIDKGYKIQTLWDFECDAEFQASVNNIRDYLLTTQIKEEFLSSSQNLGDIASITNNGYWWYHLHLGLPSLRVTQKHNIGTDLNKINTSKSSLHRAIKELLPSSIDTVLDLIQDNSLYRGAEFKDALVKFRTVQIHYLALQEELRDNFLWVKSSRHDITHIRNSVIGTLLVDLSEGLEIEKAVRLYESKVAPANYQRPKAVVTASMLDKAKQTLAELGLEPSIYRRFAQPTDLNVNNLLFVDRSSNLIDVFDALKEDLPVDINSLKNIQEISLEDFLSTGLLNQKSLAILFENRLQANLFSLINAVYPDSPSLFKWDNTFSWSYNNGVADSIRERVEKAGGKVSGKIRVSLAWETKSDLDLHMIERLGNGSRVEIYYGNKRSRVTAGELDVDAQAHSLVEHPVENIIYPYNANLLDGRYEIVVNNYNSRDLTDSFTVETEIEGKIYTYHHSAVIKHKQDVIIGIITCKNGIITYEGKGDSKLSSNEVWGINTNRFQKVSSVFESPNYWQENGQGNKHIFFHVDGAVNQGLVNPFFNEQIKAELTQNHKRVFEVLSSKIKVQDSSPQVSGFGFSTTSPNTFICKLDNHKLVRVKVGK